MARETFAGHLDLLLLAALRASPTHGYGIIERVRLASGGRFDYPDGTIYPALHRLEHEGLLRSSWQEVAGRRRRIYELTSQGEAALDGHKREWERFSRGVAAVLELAQ